MKITSVKTIGLTSIVGGGLVAAVLGFASPAQADLGHNLWANMQNRATTSTSAAADTNPLVPFGTSPQVRTSVGQHTSDHDETDTTGGRVDLAF
ncbi:MAG: hypothetical protein ABWY93_32245 [Mycobacterium sp.]